jgi:hypothetical protein
LAGKEAIRVRRKKYEGIAASVAVFSFFSGTQDVYILCDGEYDKTKYKI